VPLAGSVRAGAESVRFEEARGKTNGIEWVVMEDGRAVYAAMSDNYSVNTVIRGQYPDRQYTGA